MTTTLAFLTILGATLGLRCNVRVLALASIASAAVLTAASIDAGPLAVLGRVAAGMILLQGGYFAGMLLQAMGHAARPAPAAETATERSGRAGGPRVEGSRPV